MGFFPGLPANATFLNIYSDSDAVLEAIRLISKKTEANRMHLTAVCSAMPQGMNMTEYSLKPLYNRLTVHKETDCI